MGKEVSGREGSLSKGTGAGVCMVCLGECQQIIKAGTPVGVGVCGDWWGLFREGSGASEFGVAHGDQAVGGLAFHTKERGSFLY